uniref:Syntaxin binding protein 4 n=1 Tax=Pavo cristatus TaxID=9049 RepID=A0A8C9FG70_PAVCR
AVKSTSSTFSFVSIWDSAFQIISVCKGASLGLDIAGGIDRNEGPLVYVQEIIPGGDCHKDGRLQPGDQLVSINKESMIGVSYEEARSIIDRARARFESFCEIAFIRQKSVPSYSENLQRPSSLVPPSAVFAGQQAAGPSPAASPDTALVSALLPNAVSMLFSFQALNYLGIQPSAAQQQALRQQLQKDSKGTVSFGGNHFLISLENSKMHEYRNRICSLCSWMQQMVAKNLQGLGLMKWPVCWTRR